MQESPIVLQHLDHIWLCQLVHFNYIVRDSAIDNHLHVGVANTEDVEKWLVGDNFVWAVARGDPDDSFQTELSLVVSTAIGEGFDSSLITVATGSAVLYMSIQVAG